MFGKFGQSVVGLIDVHIVSHPTTIEISAHDINLAGAVDVTRHTPDDEDALRYHETASLTPMHTITVDIPRSELRESRVPEIWMEVWIGVTDDGKPILDDTALMNLKWSAPNFTHPSLTEFIERAVAAQHASLAVAA